MLLVMEFIFSIDASMVALPFMGRILVTAFVGTKGVAEVLVVVKFVVFVVALLLVISDGAIAVF